jgi:hypothetical protein
MFDYDQAMVYIVSESGGSDAWHRWRCDQCNELGPWTFDRDAAERDGRQHVCDKATGAAVRAD